MKPAKAYWGTAASVRAILAARFPKAIVPKGTETRLPLKLGVHRDISAACPDLTRKEITTFLSVYTSGLKYQTALVEGVERVGLDGSPDGVVTAAQQARATSIIARIEAHQAQRRKSLAEAA